MSKLAKGGVVFSLTQPVVLGSPQNFVGWFNKKFDANIKLPNTTGWPEILEGPYQDFMRANISLDTLVIDQPDHSFTIGISATLDHPQSLFAGVAFDGIGVVVSRQPNPAYCSTLASAIQESVTLLTVATGDGSKFRTVGTGETIEVGKEQMRVTKIEIATDTLTVTRGVNNTKSAAHTAGQSVIGTAPAKPRSKAKLVARKGR